MIYAITDGGDNVSKLTEKGIRQKIPQSDTQFFASLLPSPVDNRGRTPEELKGLELLPKFAADSGGGVFGPVMVNSSGSAFVLGVYPSSGVTLGDLVSNSIERLAWLSDGDRIAAGFGKMDVLEA